MIKKEDYDISSKTYDWGLRSFQALEGRLGLNIKIHNNHDLLHRGQIFLFNHFARFETVIPPYVLYATTGAYCRTIADHSLFDVNENFSEVLRSGGAVPNDLPGLLPFLAAEILRGRKVSIFPEGGMIKDRRVVDDEGKFGVFSKKSGEFRKHRRGAAVLAFTLDLFKQRIKYLFEVGDEERIKHWCDALDMSSKEELLHQANKPTLIVPATITFNPIRISDNILSRAIELFSRRVPEQLAEELAVEGNLLLSNTDMDIRLGEPIQAKMKWSWYERTLMKKYFLEVRYLEDLFGLKDQAETVVERLLSQIIVKETARVRDAYMHELYTGITVNMSHLASTLILHLIDNGQQEISFQEFHNTLYFTIKRLQSEPDVHLHRSLTRPDMYRDLPDGISSEWEIFLNTCIDAGLIQRTQTGYMLLPKLCEEHNYHQIRLENPVLVSSNEVEPIKEIKQAVIESLSNLSNIKEIDYASHLLDDETRAHAWNRAYYSKKRFLGINKKETANKSGAPYLLTPKKPARIGVLMVHGLLSSPSELKDLAQHLYERNGYAVMGVRLPGHGTSPWDLNDRTHEEWLKAVKRGHRILSAFCDEVVVVGFSAGALLSLLFASEQPQNVIGVASIAAPLTLKDKAATIVPFVQKLNTIASWIPSVEGIMPFRKNNPEFPDINYRSIPLHAINQLHELRLLTKKNLEKIETHVMLLQADNDSVVDVSSMQKIYDRLGTNKKSMHWVKSDKHGIIAGNIGDTYEIIEDFINATKNNKKTEVAS